MKTTGVVFIALALAAGSLALAQTRKQPAQARQPAGPAPAQARRPAGPAPAQANRSRAEEEKAIRGVVDAFTRAFNAGDAAAVAELFTADAQVELEDGSVVSGREAIATQFAETFASDPRPTIALKPESITFLGDDVALEEGE